MKCDFCSSPTVVGLYEAEDFSMAEVTTEKVRIMSQAQWAACADCDALVKAGDWEKLIDRSTDTFMQGRPDTPAFLRARFRKTIAEIYSKLRTIIRPAN